MRDPLYGTIEVCTVVKYIIYRMVHIIIVHANSIVEKKGHKNSD